MNAPKISLSVIIALVTVTVLTAADRSTIRQSTMVREVAHVTGGKTEEPVQRRFDTVVLENDYLALTFCPTLGERITRLRNKLTGRQLLYEGVITYSGSALNEGGGSGGGIQINHPYYHAGSSYVVPLPYHTTIDEDGTATITLAYTAYPHLQRTVWRVSLRPDEAGFRSQYRFENLAPYAMGFNPWINAAFPLRKDAQVILPADWVTGHWFGINPEEKFGHWLRPWPMDESGVDQSYLVNATEPSYFSYGITKGYSGIFFHDAKVGLARVFDPEKMPGAKSAGKWKPEPGGWDWCEVWGALSHNMEDPLWIGPHETITTDDFWFPIHGTDGMTWAGESGAVNLSKDGDKLTCGVFVPRDCRRCAVRLSADGEFVIQTSVELRPNQPFLRKVTLPADTDDVRLTVLDSNGKVILKRQEFFSKRPRLVYELPEKPWHRKTPLTTAQWEEAFTPMMAWGPWYHPPTSYAKLLESDQNNTQARIGLARSLIKEAAGDLFRGRKVSPDKQRVEAAAILTGLANVKDAHPRALRLLGTLRMQEGDAPAASAVFKRLSAAGNAGAMVYYQHALLSASDENWNQCLKHAQSAVELAPDSTLARLLAAMALLKTEQPEGATKTLAPVLEANPLEVGALVLASRAAEAIRKSDEVARVQAVLKLIERQAPEQHRAGLAQVTSLEQGKDLDCLAIDTIRGGVEMPGRKP